MKYDTSSYRKHKRPDGWGTLCPLMTQDEAQQLLEDSVQAGRARYNVSGEYCFKSFSHATTNEGETLWHGFPIKWSDLPTEAKNQLIAKGRLTNKQYRKAVKRPLELELSP